jgi:putative oxidoreductase
MISLPTSREIIVMQHTASSPSSSLSDAGALAGRLLIAALFLPAGIGKATGFAGTVGYIASVGLPAPAAAATLAMLLEIVGGLALVLGYRTRVFALAFAAFTLVASFFFHAFWAVPADQQFMQQLLFFKNIAVVGGLLMLSLQGAGRWSLDARREAGATDGQVLATRRFA